MTKRGVPKRLWDFGLVYEAKLLSRISRGSDGRTGLEEITGNTCYISEWLNFEFFDLVWFWHQPHPDLASAGKELGRWLGVSHCIGSDLCYWVVTSKGKVLARTTVQHVTTADIAEEIMKQQVTAFNAALNECLDDSNFTTAEGEAFWLEDEDELERLLIPSRDNEVEPNVGEIDDALENDEATLDDYDQYISAQVLMPKGGDRD